MCLNRNLSGKLVQCYKVISKIAFFCQFKSGGCWSLWECNQMYIFLFALNKFESVNLVPMILIWGDRSCWWGKFAHIFCFLFLFANEYHIKYFSIMHDTDSSLHWFNAFPCKNNEYNSYNIKCANAKHVWIVCHLTSFAQTMTMCWNG